MNSAVIFWTIIETIRTQTRVFSSTVYMLRCLPDSKRKVIVVVLVLRFTVLVIITG